MSNNDDDDDMHVLSHRVTS